MKKHWRPGGKGPVPNALIRGGVNNALGSDPYHSQGTESVMPTEGKNCLQSRRFAVVEIRLNRGVRHLGGPGFVLGGLVLLYDDFLD